ncbi:MAG: peptidoglycan-binding protein [Chroococcidiopsidaceae cyanobacterium CP_BM_ER_R8_30]|nr:peptidoglycan-binding protein [Chroococcidiopsidaceae cyanobacterium CP_BM_ER_R8_30]
MKLEKQILGIASAAALMTGMTGIGFAMSRPAQAAMTTGTNSSKVTELQQDLKADGFNPGPTDGVFGPRTEAAVVAFQKAHGLYPDGIAGPKTLAAVDNTNSQTASAQSQMDNKEGSEGNATPAATNTTTNANQVPTSVTKVGEYGENIYDAAQANNWTQATASLTSLKQAAQKLDNEPRIGENPNEDQLDTVIAALDKSVPAKDQLATMRSANQVTLLAANLSAPFNPQVPVSVVKLDYYGRQLQVGAAANNMTQLQETAKDISQTWNAVRPTVESRGGSAQAQKFNSLVAQVEAAKSSSQYNSLATPFLNQVDNLEKVFTH